MTKTTNVPRYCQELRELRGDTPSSRIAEYCGISRQFIRQVETGKKAPSNSVLIKWLQFLQVDVKTRPDLIRSVNSHRAKINEYVKEYVELATIPIMEDDFPLTDFLKEITYLISEGGYLPQEFVENRIYLIRQAYEQHKK
tara:strand:- start:612 stop:1034 length:423 start_codon:yes stop_codon:yes gene_type:complete